MTHLLRGLAILQLPLSGVLFAHASTSSSTSDWVLILSPVVALIVGVLAFVGSVWTARMKRPDDERLHELETMVTTLVAERLQEQEGSRHPDGSAGGRDHRPG